MPTSFKSEPWEHWGNLILGHLDSKSHCSEKAELDPVFGQLSGGFPTQTLIGRGRPVNVLTQLQPQLSFKELAVVSAGRPSSFHPRLHPSPVSPGQCLSYWEGCLCLWASPFSPFPTMSHSLWQDAHHLREITSVLGRPCFILPVPTRVDMEGHNHFHKNRVNRMKLCRTSSCPCATLDSSILPSGAQILPGLSRASVE